MNFADRDQLIPQGTVIEVAVGTNEPQAWDSYYLTLPDGRALEQISQEMYLWELLANEYPQITGGAFVVLLNVQSEDDSDLNDDQTGWYQQGLRSEGAQ